MNFPSHQTPQNPVQLEANYHYYIHELQCENYNCYTVHQYSKGYRCTLWMKWQKHLGYLLDWFNTICVQLAAKCTFSRQDDLV